MEMRDRKDEDAIGLHTVSDAKRKTMQEMLPNAADHDAERLRRVGYSRNGGIDLIKEIGTETTNSLLVPICRSNHFSIRLRVENDMLHFSLSRARRSTSSAGIHLTFPAAISASRRLISSSHNSWASGYSDSSKLAINCLAS